MDSDYEKKIYNEAFLARKAEFLKRLDAIEAENIDWFKAQPPQHETEEHDRLEHHYSYSWNAIGKIGFFKIHEDSSLPQSIKDKCWQAYMDCYGG